MAEFDRRDVVTTLTALAVAGWVTSPDKAEADGEGNTSLLVLSLIVLQLVSYVLIYSKARLKSGRTNRVKVVPDNQSVGNVPASQRVRRAPQIGTIRQSGDALYAELNAKGATALAQAKTVTVSIPLKGEQASIEMRVRNANKRNTDAVLAQSQQIRRAKTVGKLHMDNIGVIMNMPNARLG